MTHSGKKPSGRRKNPLEGRKREKSSRRYKEGKIQ
jgi:hypothetical protein